MRSSLRISLGAIALAFAFSAFTACDEKDILKRMETHSRALKTLRADITMEQYNAQLGERDTSKGKLVYMPQKNGNFAARLDWLTPHQESLAVIDKQYVLYRPQLKQAYAGTIDKSQKISVLVNDALGFINISRKRLKAGYDIKYLGREKVNGKTEAFHLEFTPKVARQYKTVDLWADDEGTPVQFKVTERNNDTTTVLFTNVEKNVAVNAADFKINLPKSTKIIKD
jgi:outer membrane lipoprotein-sorting protein